MKIVMRLTVLSVISIHLGSALNWLVILSNGGRMPVFGYASPKVDGRHQVGDEFAKLAWLADRFVMLGSSWSIGDILIFLGMPLAIVAAVWLMVIALSHPTQPIMRKKGE